MCGISGFYFPEKAVVDEAILRKASEALSSRGPDAEGFWSSQNLALVHRRLKVIDLADSANQPMFNEKKDIAMVFNGEIYNYLELRQQLQSEGVSFRTQSDSEVLLKGYEKWGESCLDILNGMFAVCFVDMRHQTPKFILARDRFGIKPLFYSLQDQKFSFASTLSVFIDSSWIPKKISRPAFFYFLKFSHVPTPLSIFENIFQLQPGHKIIYDGTNVKVEKFTNEARLLKEFAYSHFSEEQWLEDFEKTLFAVVKRQSVADVPVGCFLSGGIDSSLLSYAFSEKVSKKLKTFTIAYTEKEFDESIHASEIATLLGTDHHQITVTAQDLLDVIPDVPKRYDQPFGDPSLLPTLILMKHARQHVTVGLSGDGCDELFFGYDYQQILLRISILRHVPLFLRKSVFETIYQFVHFLSQFWPSRKKQIIKKFCEILQAENDEELLQYFVGTVGPLRLDRLASGMAFDFDKSQGPIKNVLASMETASWVRQIEQVFESTFLVDTVLAKTDRASMAFGLEARVPFLDNQFLAFSRQMPFHLKFNGNSKKYLLRKYLSEKLSPKLGKRPKQGFGVPIREWMKKDLKNLMQDVLSERELQKHGLLKKGFADKLMHEHLNEISNHSHLLWSLMSFQLWYGHYSKKVHFE